MSSILGSQAVCQRFLFVFPALCGAQRLHPHLRVQQARDSHVFRVSCKFSEEAYPVGLFLHDLHLSVRDVIIQLSELLASPYRTGAPALGAASAGAGTGRSH